MSSLPDNFSLEELKKHPILDRVLDRLAERLKTGIEMSSHSAHNSHYSSLAKDEKNGGDKP